MFSKIQVLLVLSVSCVLCSHHEIKVERLNSPKSVCGEGPHWDAEKQSLYYIDIEGTEATLLRYDLREDRTYMAKVDNEPLMTFVLPVQDEPDHFLIGAKNAAKVVKWDGISEKAEYVRTAFEIETELKFKTNRFNDAKCDPRGRFFGGTQRLSGCDGSYNLANASLYRYEPRVGVQQIRENVFISNGLTWIGNKFYYIDSCSYDVKEFDYDEETGGIAKPVSVFTIKKDADKKPDYVLDGMTNDIEGNLIIATWDGRKIMKVNPKTGEVLKEVELPANQVTSVAFGGPNMDILFVTTASRGGDQPILAGHLYKVLGMGSGTPGVKVKLHA